MTALTSRSLRPLLAGLCLPLALRAADAPSIEDRVRALETQLTKITQENSDLKKLLGITPKGQDASKAAPNHSPRFFVDEAALLPGIRAMASLAVDYLQTGKTAQ